jgi:hypothetical protein
LALAKTHKNDHRSYVRKGIAISPTGHFRRLRPGLFYHFGDFLFIFQCLDTCTRVVTLRNDIDRGITTNVSPCAAQEAGEQTEAEAAETSETGADTDQDITASLPPPGLQPK